MKIFAILPNGQGEIFHSLEEMKARDEAAYNHFLGIIKPENRPLVRASMEKSYQAAEQAMANPFTVVEYEARGPGRAYVFAVPDAALQPLENG